MKLPKHKTELIPWMWPEIETANGSRYEDIARPPWFAVRYRDERIWGRRWCYSWTVYGGPPRLFLTKRQSQRHATELRKQYKCKTEVIIVVPRSGDDWVKGKP